MILQILGVIFLIIICIVAFYGWKFYRLIKKHTNSDLSVAISVLPPQSMDLEPSSATEWKEKERLAHMESQLKTIGASHVGYFEVYHAFTVIRLSMWNFKEQAVAVIYETYNEKDKTDALFMYEVACKLVNGSLCITSYAPSTYLSRPPNHIIIHNESSSIVKFMKLLKAEISADRKLQKISDAKEFFQDVYEDTTEWGWRKEQLQSDKTRQTLTSVGVKITDRLMDELIEMGELYSVNVHVDKARRKLAKISKMSIDEWEKIRDNLIIINERMKSEHLIDAVYEAAGELTEGQEQILDGFQKTSDELVDPIGAFQMLAQSMNLKIKRLTTMDTPVRTEIYLPLSVLSS